MLDTNIYTAAPSDEVDKAWDGLYECTYIVFILGACYHDLEHVILIETIEVALMKISELEENTMLNNSLRIPGDENKYIVLLDVYHQLHCLVSPFMEPMLLQPSASKMLSTEHSARI